MKKEKISKDVLSFILGVITGVLLTLKSESTIMIIIAITFPILAYGMIKFAPMMKV